MTRDPDPEFVELRAAVQAALVETEARLRALRREFDEIVESGSLTNTDDEHDPDGATIAYERARTAARRSSTYRWTSSSTRRRSRPLR